MPCSYTLQLTEFNRKNSLILPLVTNPSEHINCCFPGTGIIFHFVLTHTHIQTLHKHILWTGQGHVIDKCLKAYVPIFCFVFNMKVCSQISVCVCLRRSLLQCCFVSITGFVSLNQQCD